MSLFDRLIGRVETVPTPPSSPTPESSEHYAHVPLRSVWSHTLPSGATLRAFVDGPSSLVLSGDEKPELMRPFLTAEDMSAFLKGNGYTFERIRKEEPSIGVVVKASAEAANDAQGAVKGPEGVPQEQRRAEYLTIDQDILSLSNQTADIASRIDAISAEAATLSAATLSPESEDKELSFKVARNVLEEILAGAFESANRVSVLLEADENEEGRVRSGKVIVDEAFIEGKRQRHAELERLRTDLQGSLAEALPALESLKKYSTKGESGEVLAGEGDNPTVLAVKKSPGRGTIASGTGEGEKEKKPKKPSKKGKGGGAGDGGDGTEEDPRAPDVSLAPEVPVNLETTEKTVEKTTPPQAAVEKPAPAEIDREALRRKAVETFWNRTEGKEEVAKIREELKAEWGVFSGTLLKEGFSEEEISQAWTATIVPQLRGTISGYLTQRYALPTGTGADIFNAVDAILRDEAGDTRNKTTKGYGR